MLTGDAKRVAESVAKEVGVTDVYSELLPADKVSKVEELLEKKPAKEKLVFVGDGIMMHRYFRVLILVLPWVHLVQMQR